MVAPMFFSCDGNVLKWGVRFPLQWFFVEPIVDLFNYVLIALHKWFAGFERFWLLRRNAIFHFSVSPIGVPQDYRFLGGWGFGHLYDETPPTISTDTNKYLIKQGLYIQSKLSEFHKSVKVNGLLDWSWIMLEKKQYLPGKVYSLGCLLFAFNGVFVCLSFALLMRFHCIPSAFFCNSWNSFCISCAF